MGLGVVGLLVWWLLRDPAGAPKLLVQGWVIDNATGEPVKATVFLNGVKAFEALDNSTVEVPSTPEGFYVEVIAEGYERWGFRYQLKGGYLFKGPIRLIKEGGLNPLCFNF